mmetsp:Transcript_16502/g.51196  ORF Transcript_16502/g.51196 Transcript_16502/m.51196 type:complete len:272 (-) Transcript_16502:995-1810(-)
MKMTSPAQLADTHVTSALTSIASSSVPVFGSSTSTLRDVSPHTTLLQAPNVAHVMRGSSFGAETNDGWCIDLPSSPIATSPEPLREKMRPPVKRSQTCNTSRSAVSRRVPSWLKATCITAERAPVSTCSRTSPACAPHTKTSPFCDPLATRFPRRLNATQYTAPEWRWNIVSASAFRDSHKFTKSSVDDVAIVSLSSLMATAFACDVTGISRSFLPLFKSHRHTLPSLLDVSRNLPSRECAIATTGSRCARISMISCPVSPSKYCATFPPA